MTKTKALKLMLEMSRDVIDPGLARKIAQAFKFTLPELEIKPRKVKDFRLLYSEETENLLAVSVSNLARQIAYKQTGILVTTGMNGAGSGAEDIAKKALEIIK